MYTNNAGIWRRILEEKLKDNYIYTNNMLEFELNLRRFLQIAIINQKSWKLISQFLKTCEIFFHVTGG